MPVTFGQRAVWPRGLFGGIFLFFIIIVCVASMATPLAVKRSVVKTQKVTFLAGPTLARQVDIAPFRTCQDFPTAYSLGEDDCGMTHKSYDRWLKPNSGDCTKYKHYVRSIQAFYLLTLIFCCAAFITSIMNSVGKVSSWVTFGLVFVAALMALLSWILVIAFYTVDLCNQRKMFDDNSFSIGPSLFLMVAVFAALLCMLILLFVMEHGPHDQNKAKPKPVQVLPPVAQAPTPVPLNRAPHRENQSTVFDL